MLFALPALLAVGLLGLDRVPEVRTLREKIRLLSGHDHPEQWSAELCRGWMEAAPEHAGTLYVDGHVRVYRGHQTVDLGIRRRYFGIRISMRTPFLGAYRGEFNETSRFQLVDK